MDIVRIGNWTKNEKPTKPFTYNYIKKNIQVTDKNTLDHIKSLHIPPAWINVQISSNPKTKIQAYGLDSKGRKQVIYAKWFTQQNKDSKYTKIMQLEPIIKTKVLLKPIEKEITEEDKTIIHLLYNKYGVKLLTLVNSYNI